MSHDIETYKRQSFGSTLEPQAPVGLLIVDLVNGFANPEVFGGGNIPQAIEHTIPLLAHARERAGRSRTAASFSPMTTPITTSSR